MNRTRLFPAGRGCPEGVALRGLQRPKEPALCALPGCSKSATACRSQGALSCAYVRIAYAACLQPAYPTLEHDKAGQMIAIGDRVHSVSGWFQRKNPHNVQVATQPVAERVSCTIIWLFAPGTACGGCRPTRRLARYRSRHRASLTCAPAMTATLLSVPSVARGSTSPSAALSKLSSTWRPTYVWPSVRACTRFLSIGNQR